MSRTAADPPETGEQEPTTEALYKAFARALNTELDRIGYPPPPLRTNQLGEDLGGGRMQAYRILRGEHLPTLKLMLRLQSIGVSIDAVLEQLQESPPDEVAVEILGVPIRAVVRRAPGMPFVVSRKDAGADLVLRLAEPGEQLGEEDIPVGGLRFTRPQPVVAVIEDDKATLAVFRSELALSFNVVTFPNDKALVSDPSRLRAFDAFVLDWVLPGRDGLSIVNFIRTHTQAPIVVTTGYRDKSAAISSILGMPDLYYVAKPVEGAILRAMISAAVARGPQIYAERGATGWLTQGPSK
jgi:CheY-like chemotaxis protein